jgi:hypothetical protein
MIKGSKGILTIAFAVLVFSVLPASAATVSISGSPFVVAPGGTAFGLLNASGVTNLGSATVNLTYNPSVVIVTGVSAGSGNALNVPAFNIDNVAGVVQIIANNASGMSSPPDVIIANITFQAVGSAGQSSPLNITIREFIDKNFSDIGASPSNGSFNIGLRSNISGYKINDTNNNSVWDPGEVGIGGWNITLKNATGASIASILTDGSGFYQFTNIVQGSYNVTEENRVGWIHTNASSQSIILAGSDITNLNFTNRMPPPANISGYKINDTNSNGVWDPGELGIPNWNITLLNGTNTIASTQTDANGFYNFTNLPSDSYVVIEENRTGWIHTNASSKSIILVGSDITNLNFTNLLQPQKPKVPAFTPFGLIALSVMLGLIAVVAIRRRL